MRIRIFHAFASNNSGSYTIVGTFASAADAADVALTLHSLIQRHDAWFARGDYDEDSESPLDLFVRQHGLSEVKPGRVEQWPEYGDEPPAVLAIAHQVLVHAPMTLTMPRLFGEFFYKQGGRVDVEIEHAHGPIAVTFSFFAPNLAWDDAEGGRRIDALQQALTPVLASLVAPTEDDDRPAVSPVFHLGFWKSRHLTVVFRDVVEGVEAVRRIAAQHGVQVHVRLSECAECVIDPLLHLRTTTRPRGRASVILWSSGTDHMACLKALREVMETGLAEAKGALERLPAEVLVDVEQRYAEQAVEALRAAGCDAEAVTPSTKG